MPVQECLLSETVGRDVLSLLACPWGVCLPLFIVQCCFTSTKLDVCLPLFIVQCCFTSTKLDVCRCSSFNVALRPQSWMFVCRCSSFNVALRRQSWMFVCRCSSFNVALRPQRPYRLLRANRAQDVYLDFHIAPGLWFAAV